MADPYGPNDPTTPAASIVVAALERAWQQIRAYHRELPQVVVIVASALRRGPLACRWRQPAGGPGRRRRPPASGP